MSSSGSVVPEPDMGDLIVVLLASTLAGLRDRLAEDGFEPAAQLVADLVDIADDYVTNCTEKWDRSDTERPR